MTISNEALESAAKAYRGEFPYDENEGYVVKLILEAAAPIIRAECLEEAGDELHRLNPPHSAWLRARAVAERGRK